MKEQIDQFHKHELLDRIHCINEMFDSLVANHPAAPLIADQIKEAADKLGELYQAAGAVY